MSKRITTIEVYSNIASNIVRDYIFTKRQINDTDLRITAKAVQGRATLLDKELTLDQYEAILLVLSTEGYTKVQEESSEEPVSIAEEPSFEQIAEYENNPENEVAFCRTCQGYGYREVVGQGNQKCPNCNGRGRVPVKAKLCR